MARDGSLTIVVPGRVAQDSSTREPAWSSPESAIEGCANGATPWLHIGLVTDIIGSIRAAVGAQRTTIYDLTVKLNVSVNSSPGAPLEPARFSPESPVECLMYGAISWLQIDLATSRIGSTTGALRRG